MKREISACDHCHRLMNSQDGKICSAGYNPTPWKSECIGFEENRKLKNPRKPKRLRNGDKND